MNKALAESFKELLRVVVLAVLPVLIDSIISGQIEFRTLAVVGAVAGLRFVDKFLHEQAKAAPQPEGGIGKLHGLTGF